MENEVKHVLITGAAGQIGYILAFKVACGEFLGIQQHIVLHLLDIEPMLTKLKGIYCELIDCAYPNLDDIIYTADLETACKDVDYAFLLASIPLKEGGVRADMLRGNASIFHKQGEALSKFAKPTLKCLVVGNPDNTNCFVALRSAPNLGPANFGSMSTLDHLRAVAKIAKKLKVPISSIKNVVVWGNHGETQVPYIEEAICVYPDGTEKKVIDLLGTEYIRTKFLEKIAQRAWKIRELRGNTSAASAANAAFVHLKKWIFGTDEGEIISLGIPVPDNEPYGIKKGIIFSFPCTVDKEGVVHVYEGFKIDDFYKEKILASEQDLINEREQALAALKAIEQ